MPEVSKTQMRKGALKPLCASSVWRHDGVFQHRGSKVECVVVQEGRYWKTKGYLHRSPNQAMDRIEGRI
jgi:hypothetical protein